MKKIYRAMAGIILALLLAIGLASLFTTGVGSDGADTSKPQFSMQALLDGTFISKLETWYTNTFPMRDTLLKANRWLNGFYHSSAGDDNILVLDGNTGAEQGGESLARQEYEKTGQTLENEPQPSQETSGDAEITNPETGAETAAPETATGETSGEAHTEPTPEPTEEDSVPELDNPDISEAQYAGNVVIVGDRAMEIPTATNSVI
ncbi:MAG: DHHW family protein, partial [Oscillospiraceae bacterium]